MTGGRAILVVDGNPLIRSTARRMLRNEAPRAEVIEADGFAAALHLVRTRRPEVVITAIHLNEGSGLKLTEKIAADFPDILVIVFSNADETEYRKEALKRGARYFVSKAAPNGGVILDIIRKQPWDNDKN